MHVKKCKCKERMCFCSKCVTSTYILPASSPPSSESSWHIPLNFTTQPSGNDKSTQSDEPDRERSKTYPTEDHTEPMTDFSCQLRPQTCDVGTQTVSVTNTAVCIFLLIQFSIFHTSE